jgi:hypothetical protein
MQDVRAESARRFVKHAILRPAPVEPAPETVEGYHPPAPTFQQVMLDAAIDLQVAAEETRKALTPPWMRG